MDGIAKFGRDPVSVQFRNFAHREPSGVRYQAREGPVGRGYNGSPGCVWLLWCFRDFDAAEVVDRAGGTVRFEVDSDNVDAGALGIDRACFAIADGCTEAPVGRRLTRWPRRFELVLHSRALRMRGRRCQASATLTVRRPETTGPRIPS